MWAVISNVARNMNGTIVLTTHSMEEAEALCGRVTIMVDGEMRCLGSCQRLKDRYGDGFQIICKLSVQGGGDQEYDDLVEAAQFYFSNGKKADIDGVKAFINEVSPNHPEIAALVSPTTSESAEGMQLANSSLSKARANLPELCGFIMHEKRFARFVCVIESAWGADGVRVTERNGSTVRLMVKRVGIVGGVGELFSFMEGLKSGDEGGGGQFVDDYTVSQTTLEDIFRNIAGRDED